MIEDAWSEEILKSSAEERYMCPLNIVQIAEIVLWENIIFEKDMYEVVQIPSTTGNTLRWSCAVTSSDDERRNLNFAIKDID